MAKSYSIRVVITTHTETGKSVVIKALKTALKPLVLDGTIWTVNGAIEEVYTPDTFTVEE